MSGRNSVEVVLCSDCTQPWLFERSIRQSQQSVTCPVCGSEHESVKIVASSEHGSDHAAELRSRYLAKRANATDEYRAILNEFGSWGAQKDEIEARIPEPNPDVDEPGPYLEEAVDAYYGPSSERSVDGQLRGAISPFYEMQDRFETLANHRIEEAHREHRDRFADLVTFEDEEWTRYQDWVDDILEGYADEPRISDLPSGKVTPTDQTLPEIRLDLDADATITAVWEELFEYDKIRIAFAESVRSVLEGLDSAEVYDRLEEASIPYWLRSWIVGAARGSNRNAWAIAVEVLPRMHTYPLCTTGDLLATATLFAAVDNQPSIGAVVHEGWLENRDRSQRVDVCNLLSVLATDADVRVVASGLVLRKLATRHRLDLPGVSEWMTHDRTAADIHEQISTARAELDDDSREIKILELLADEPSGTLAYSQLYGCFQVQSSRVRQCIGTLVDLDLTDTHGPQSARKVTIKDLGKTLLEEINLENARQRRLESPVSGLRQDSTKGRDTRRTKKDEMEEEAAGENDHQSWRTTWLDAPSHVAAAETAVESGLSLCSASFQSTNENVRLVSYDDTKDEVVVAVEAADPMTYVVSSAIALTWAPLLEQVLPPTRIEAIDEPPIVVREGRCVGGATENRLENGSEYLEYLTDWGRELEDMTRRLKHGDYGEFESRCAFRRELLRQSHGLFGTIVHLLDAVGVDVVREIRVPAGADKERQLQNLAKSIAVSASIQSVYKGVYASYRQLFEQRSGKRERALTPAVDSADPFGHLIGSIVVRGPDIHRLEPSLRTFLEEPTDEHEDAPKIVVAVPVEHAGRDAYQRVMNRICRRKRIKLTSEAVSVCHTMVGSPYELAKALYYQLEKEDTHRNLRSDEVRRVLAAIKTDLLCPDLPPAAQKLVATLLSANEPVELDVLLERAGISERSLQRHRDRLSVVGLLEKTDSGYRCPLAFPESEKYHTEYWPSTTSDSFLEGIDALLLTELSPERYGDPTDPLGGLLFYPRNPGGAIEDTVVGPWAELIRRLTATPLLGRQPTTISMGSGPSTVQQPLPTA